MCKILKNNNSVFVGNFYFNLRFFKCGGGKFKMIKFCGKYTNLNL